MKTFFKTHLKKLLFGLAVFTALIYFTLGKIPSQTEVNFLNIGQGDSILIVTPDLQTVLIDGGPGETVLEELGDILPFFVRDIDLMILTHPHRDHIEGLVEVLKRYEVHQLLLSGDEYGSTLYSAFLKVASEKEATGELQVYFAESENDFKIETGDGYLFFDVLYPIKNSAGKTYENTNNASVVIRMSWISAQNPLALPRKAVGQTFLFTGDCEIECEEEILHYYSGLDVQGQKPSQLDGDMSNPLDADILKIGHHGSRTSTSQKFLDAVSPSTAVIQSGTDNQFDHPHPETLEKLKNAGVKIRRNDLEGRIVMPIN